MEFLEWTEADRLRHSKFVGLREGKDTRSVVKEHGDEAQFLSAFIHGGGGSEHRR